MGLKITYFFLRRNLRPKILELQKWKASICSYCLDFGSDLVQWIFSLAHRFLDHSSTAQGIPHHLLLLTKPILISDHFPILHYKSIQYCRQRFHSLFSSLGRIGLCSYNYWTSKLQTLVPCHCRTHRWACFHRLVVANRFLAFYLHNIHSSTCHDFWTLEFRLLPIRHSS
jgi:hypothetical protein